MKKVEIEEKEEELPKESSEMVLEGLNPQTDPEMFYAVSNYIQSYLNYNSVKFETRDEKTVEEKGEIVLNILSEDYKKKNNITSQNIKEYMYDGNGYLAFYPLKMNEIIEGDIFTNIAYGFLEDEITGEYVQDAYYIVRLDTKNNTIDIEPVNNVDSINEIKISNNVGEIKKNENNNFVSLKVNIPNLINRYIANYEKLLKNYPELAYEFLDKEYRMARFGTLDEFKEYSRTQSEKISNIILDKYQTQMGEGYRKFVCIDKDGKYYIIKETAVMQYTIILDTYTINIPEFLEKYEKAKPEEKVILNINKFMQAINDENYKYAYSILADNFREKNFTTLEAFEEYAKANFFKNNKFSYEKFGSEANMYYTYDINITDASSGENESISKKKTFVVLLEEGTDFKLSFNI